MRAIHHYEFSIRFDEDGSAKVCSLTEADLYVNPSRIAYVVTDGVIDDKWIGHFSEQCVDAAHLRPDGCYVRFRNNRYLQFFQRGK